MDLSPSAWLEALTPSVLAVAAVTSAFVAAFALAVSGLLHLALRRRHRAARRGREPGGLSEFTWTSAEE